MDDDDDHAKDDAVQDGDDNCSAPSKRGQFISKES